MIEPMIGSPRGRQSAATAVSLLVALLFSLGVPLHLSHDHHAHRHLNNPLSHASIDHEHHRHDIVDHDWDGLRAQFQYSQCLPAAGGYGLSAAEPQTIAVRTNDVAIHSVSCLGPPSYRAPPFA